MNNPQGNTVSEVGASTEELIARLEKATGPDIELDYAIAEAVGLKIPSNRSIDPPFFTASIDAALTLVPKGCEWECGSATLLLGGNQHWAKVIAPNAEFIGKLKPAAIVLCIAALKARKATGATDTHRDSVNEQRAGREDS